MFKSIITVLILSSIFNGCITTSSISSDCCRSYANGATTDDAIGAIAIVSGAAIIASIAYLTTKSNKKY